MLALAATRFCSACRMSGRRCSSVEGRSAGIERRDELVDGLAARDRARVAPEQDRDQVLQRRDLLLDGRDRGQRLLVLRPDLRDLGLRHDAGLEAQVEDARGLAEVRRRRLRDLALAVERAQRDVGGRDVRDHREHDAALRLLARVDLRLRGLGQAAHAAEEVELPRGAERRLVQREVGIGRLRDRRHAERGSTGSATRPRRSRSAGRAATASRPARRRTGRRARRRCARRGSRAARSRSGRSAPDRRTAPTTSCSRRRRPSDSRCATLPACRRRGARSRVRRCSRRRRRRRALQVSALRVWLIGVLHASLRARQARGRPSHRRNAAQPAPSALAGARCGERGRVHAARQSNAFSQPLRAALVDKPRCSRAAPGKVALLHCNITVMPQAEQLPQHASDREGNALPVHRSDRRADRAVLLFKIQNLRDRDRFAAFHERRRFPYRCW